MKIVLFVKIIKTSAAKFFKKGNVSFQVSDNKQPVHTLLL